MLLVVESNEMIVFICLDGCSWDYIRAAKMPNLAEILRVYSSVNCKAMVPTVTNVNNAYTDWRVSS